MTENTIQVTTDDSTENYTVFESADGSTIVGMYVADEIAEQLGEFAAVTISDADDASDDATAGKKKDTSNYGVFELPPAVTGIYISHDALESDETEEGDREAPENIGLELSPSDEETFNEGLEEQADALVSDEDDEEEEDEASVEEQAQALVRTSDAGSEADSDESESADEDSDVEISDEEIGLE